MSSPDLDQLHRSTLGVYGNLMEQFNPGLQRLVSLGYSYIQAFQALATTSEAYFSALSKMGEQALHSMSSSSLGDVIIQISESQRRLTAELEGVFRWFHNEVLQEMESNVRLDKDYILSSRRRYEVEVRNQAATLERQLRRGAYRDFQDGSDYVQFLRYSQRDALQEEERRYRFLAEKHCGLTQSILYLMNKTGGSLQQKAEEWRNRVNETRAPRPRTPSRLEQDAAMGMREERDQRWTGREDLPIGRVPSRAPSPLLSRSRPNSPGGSLGGGGGRQMQALVPHPPSSNPTILPFSRGEMITVMVKESRNGWLYGRAESSQRQGWFPAAYVAPVGDFPTPAGSRTSTLRSSSSMSNLLDERNGRSQNGNAPPAPPLPMPGQRPAMATADRRAESTSEASGVHQRPPQEEKHPNLFPRGTNPFATVKLRPTTTNDRSAPRIH
ncbi:brain-specific angiogenesis inhibitor 1-associated protein 2-like protein 2 isoform X1 [Anguilla rostrata]|uniref:brain-specific angiogenesis inhibitor 1-associated protein 2-like protein 2 isoform X1 n=1 Tax=Anguilla rostrata TaxID=7938 RepID=UPI0030CCEB1C